MTSRRKVAHVRELTGAKGTTYRVDWFYDGKRHRTPTLDRARAGQVATIVDEHGGDITAAEALAIAYPKPDAADEADDLPTDLGYWVDRWFAENAAPEPATTRIYRYQMRRLIPYRDYDVTTWTAHTSQSVLADMVTVGGAAPSTASEAFGRVASALRLAHTVGVRTADLPESPWIDVESPGIALTEDEIDRIVAAATGDVELYDAVTLMIETGMRIGEVCALQGGDLDVRRGAIKIRRTVKADSKSVGKPKNGRNGVRTVVIDPSRESDVWRMLTRRALHVGREGFLFHSRSGVGNRPKDPTRFALPHTMRDRWDKIVRGTVGVPATVRFHDLRHTAGSVLIAEGHPSFYIAKRLGMSIATFERTYLHELEAAQDAIALTTSRLSSEREARRRRSQVAAVSS